MNQDNLASKRSCDGTIHCIILKSIQTNINTINILLRSFFNFLVEYFVFIYFHFFLFSIFFLLKPLLIALPSVACTNTEELPQSVVGELCLSPAYFVPQFIDSHMNVFTSNLLCICFVDDFHQ